MHQAGSSYLNELSRHLTRDSESGSPSLPPRSVVTLGSWGLAHVSGAWSIDGRPRLVGRELESVRLLHTLDEVVRERVSAVVTISAPAGMGKSRLIEETLVLARVSGFDDRVYSVSALPGDAPYALVARLVRARFGIELGEDDAVQRRMLLSRVASILRDERVGDVCLFLGQLLGITFEQTPLVRALSQDAFHRELALESILCDLFAADAQRAPICYVVEDLQHADSASLTLLMALLDGMGGASLTICSARPEFFAKNEHFSQFSSARHEHLDLAPLERCDVHALMQQMLGPRSVEETALEQYLFEAGLGNPGLMRTLTSELWSCGALTSPDVEARPTFRPERLRPLDALDEQPEVIETRVHGLPEDQRLALEAAAVVGSACWFGLWAALMRTMLRESQAGNRELDGLLERLVAGGHLLRLSDSRIEGEVEYLFKRPSDRQLLLRQLTASKRNSYHRAIADWLTDCPSVHQSSELTAILARHLAASGSSYRAALAMLEAGQLARAEGSNAEAAGYFRRGLADLGEHDNRRRLDALHAYGAVLSDLGKPTAAREIFSAMLDLADQLGLDGKRGAALNRLGRSNRDCGDLTQARRCFEQALAAFELVGDARGRSATKDDLGNLMLLEGDYLAALPWLRSGLEERKAIGERRSVALSLGNVALVWQEQGKTAAAEEALGVAHQLFGLENDVRGRCDTLLSLGKLATHRRDFVKAELCFRGAHDLASDACDRARLARSLVQLGETKLRLNDVVAAEPLLTRAIELAESVEAWLDVSEARRALAKLQLKRRRLGEARRNIRLSLHLARRARSRAQLSATLRTLAEIAAAGAWSSSTAGRAVGYYMLSIELAKQTNNELQLAKGYRSFARYAERYERREIQEQSSLLRDLSDEIFQRYEVRS
jgi:hypothetical protein